MITFPCPSCAITISAPDTAAGRTVRCPKCKTRFNVAALPQEVAAGRLDTLEEVRPPPQPVDLDTLDVEDAPRPSFRGGPSTFSCPFCGTHYPPNVSTRISGSGWGMMVALVFAHFVLCVLLAFAAFPCAFVFLLAFPLCFVPLFTLKESYQSCSSCGVKLG